jgi:hypothetical protein
MQANLETFASLMAGYGGSTYSHWPLNDASFSTSAGTINDTQGYSDDAENHWVDDSGGGGAPLPEAQETALITGGASSCVKLNTVSGTTRFRDQFHLGDCPARATTATFLVWLMLDTSIGDDSTFGEEAIISGPVSGQTLWHDGNTSPDQLRKTGGGAGFTDGRSNEVFMCAVTESDATNSIHYLYDGTGLRRTGASTAFTSTVVKNDFILQHGIPLTGGTHSRVWFQDAYWLNGTELSQAQLDELYTIATGVAVS